MTGFAIFLLVFALVFYILTRETYVFVIYSGRLSLEFHLVIFSLVLSEGDSTDKSFKPKLKFYQKMIKELTRLSEKCYIKVHSIRLARLNSLLSPTKIPYSYAYHMVISSLLAYFSAKSKKLTIEDNSLTLIPDSQQSDFVNVSLCTELYNILFVLVKMLVFFKKYSKEGLKNVGN